MTKQHVAICRLCALSLTVYLSLFTFVLQAAASDKPDLLTQQIRATAIKGQTIDQVLSHLTYEYGISMGIELGDQKSSPDRKIDLNLPETSVKDFLDAVIAKDPRYTWKLEGGVIHVWPLTERDTLLATLLDTKISHFAVAERSSRYAIQNDILNVPDIKSKLIVADVAPMIFLNFATMDKLEKGIGFEESDLTLRELLDKFTQKTKINRWVLSRWGENNEYITLRS